MDAKTLDLTVDGTSIQLACLHRPGPRAPLVSLHGFGSTKEDYADVSMRPEFQDRCLFFWDAPGFGASDIDDPSALSIPFLVKVALAAFDAVGVDRFHLTGHSMGGLTGLLLANEHQERVLSFMNIEGNIAPEDCFLSRQIVEHPATKAADFVKGFIDRVRHRAEYGSAIYAAALPAKVRDTTFEPIFTSMVALSDGAPLMEMFTGLTCPRAFVYGAQNRHLSYLADLPEKGVEVLEIPHSGHFPMYSNPPALWATLADFLERHDPIL
ncbi:MAG: alpha/beta hydrolase [Pseudomonadota bacterium]